MLENLNDRAREALAATGGLASQADLARRWGMTRQRVFQMTREPAFPPPATQINGHAIWLVDEAEHWKRYRAVHIARARLDALATSV